MADSSRRRRACDRCRRDKRRCNGGDRCTQCANHNVACTYLTPAATQFRAYLDESSADSDSEDPSTLSSKLENPEHDNAYTLALKQRIRSMEEALVLQQQPWLSFRMLTVPLPPPHPDDYDEGLGDVAGALSAMSLQSEDGGYKGKSSSDVLIRAARRRKPPGKHLPQGTEVSSPTTSGFGLHRRFPDPPRAFPALSHLKVLAESYFARVHPLVPILHRPTFDALLRAEHHVVDPAFWKLTLLVCALGDLHYSGVQSAWNWYNHAGVSPTAMRTQSSLNDLQAHCLAVFFLACVDHARSSWILSGFALRIAYDIEAHRARDFRGGSSRSLHEDEMEKRAFWMLWILDVKCSAELGRGPSLDPVDFDLAMPLPFPSSSASDHAATHTDIDDAKYLTALAGLTRILCTPLRIIYSLNNRRMTLGVTHNTPRFTTALDAALDIWLANLPAHLVWSSSETQSGSTESALDQSATLYAMYYYARMITHQQFLPPVAKSMGISTIGLSDPYTTEQCVNAARACITLLFIHANVRPWSPLWVSQVTLFTSAMVLILVAESETHTNTDSDIQLAQVAVNLLKAQSEQWLAAGYYVKVVERTLASLRYKTPTDSGPISMPMPPAFAGDEPLMSAGPQRTRPRAKIDSMRVPHPQTGASSLHLLPEYVSSNTDLVNLRAVGQRLGRSIAVFGWPTIGDVTPLLITFHHAKLVPVRSSTLGMDRASSSWLSESWNVGVEQYRKSCMRGGLTLPLMSSFEWSNTPTHCRTLLVALLTYQAVRSSWAPLHEFRENSF
ncbi:fungal-specific transcription factor domain-containing protein [Mycena amicta]|nr:fungal-specific transcription factor domain-containing protein [Mycena amicta]